VQGLGGGSPERPEQRTLAGYEFQETLSEIHRAIESSVPRLEIDRAVGVHCGCPAGLPNAGAGPVLVVRIVAGIVENSRLLQRADVVAENPAMAGSMPWAFG